MIAYSLCNKLPTALSRPFIFNTDGCATCGGLDYCKRFKPSSELEWLDAIKINNVEFKSGNNFGYGYYVGSNHQWIFEKGKDYTIEFKAGYLNDTSQLVLAAWIDYNENGDFENIENIAIPTTKFESSITYNLHIPANAISGLTRMRVCLKFAEISEATPIPCFQSLEFGEYEDYCVLITSATCNPVTSIDLSSIDPQTAKLSIVDPAAVAFRFSYRKLYDGPWISNISSAHQILLNGLDSCSRYELKLQSICNEFESKASFYEFNTGGTGCTVSAENAVRSQISVYPNPFTNELIILNKDEIYISAVHLFSVAGNNIYSSKVESNIKQLRMSFDIKPGYYILQVISKNGMIKNIPVICTAY
jgi:hypothetical protein